MVYRLELSYTGDFWIDQGLITIWSLLTSKARPSLRANSMVARLSKTNLYRSSKKEIGSITLTHDKMILEFTNEKKLESQVAMLAKRLRSRYLRKASTGRLWWYGLARSFYSHITSGIDSFFLTPNQVVSEKKSKWTKGVCDFCGMADRYVKEAGATEHPLVVISGKFSSFYSHLKGQIKICNWCAFASKFSPLQMFFSLAGNELVGVCLESDNLLTRVKVYNEFSKLFAEASDYRNFPRVLYRTKLPLETFLDFLFATKQEIERKKSELGRDMIEENEITRVHVFHGLSGRALMIDKYYVIPNLPSIFHFVTNCYWKSKQGRKYNALFATMNMLVEKRGTDVDTTFQEEFARRLLYRKDISRVLELYLIRNIQNSNQNFTIFDAINTGILNRMYTLNQLGLDSRLLAVVENIGEMIGEITHEQEGNMTLLYNLRSVGNLDALLSYLHQLFTRNVDKIRPDKQKVESLLREINNSNWVTYKSLIGIYAALQYIELEGRVARPIVKRS